MPSPSQPDHEPKPDTTPTTPTSGTPKRLLITGVAGFLGAHVAQVAAQAGWAVVGATRSMPASTIAAAERVVAADLAEPGAARDAIETLAPDAVIHCAANARTNECEKSPEAAERDNVLATRLLAQACASDGHGVPLVVCSTDLVFDGERPNHKQPGMYTERDEPNPINAYGRSKLAMERMLGEMASHAIIARLPLLFGPPADASGKPSFLGGWVEHLRRGEALVLFTDEWRTPLSARDAARGLLACLARGEPGATYHLAGAERINRYELGLRFARHGGDVLGFDASLLQPGVRADVPMPAPRAADVSLDGARAQRELGFTPGALDDELAWTARAMAALA
ncbi:MAG: SDR family oxidoreductase [Phycisphaerales bacterium]